MSPAMETDEFAWVLECAAAGDSPAEIAQAAGRPVSDIEAALGDLRPLTERERLIASLWAAGLTQEAVAGQAGLTNRYAKNAVSVVLKRIRAKGYPVPKRSDRWAERRQSILDRQEPRP